MNNDQMKGRVNEAKGTTKEAVGRVTRKPDVELRGAGEKLAGKAQKSYGDTREDLKKPR